MGCICEAHYYVSQGWLVRELRLFENGILASESTIRMTRIENEPAVPMVEALAASVA